MTNSEEIIKNVGSWGNSAGILLPREWIGNQVKVILIERSLEIKKEVFSILFDYLEDIVGIYLTGSYARGEQDENSDIDIIAISNKTQKEIVSGKYSISIIPLINLKKTLIANPILILPRVNEAKTLLNPLLLEELKKTKISKNSFKQYFKDTREVLSINKKLLSMEKNFALEANEIIYSLMLRLRGIYLIKCFISKKNYNKKGFLKWIAENISSLKDAEKAYSIYLSIRDNLPNKKLQLNTATANLLAEFIEKELNKLN